MNYSTDEKYMQRCLQLARGGVLGAPPNPMVGAVLVAPDGRIIGEGFHARCGEGHAEVNCFASVRPADRDLVPSCTLYVSLEPCAHFGRTPPCARLIVQRGVKRVVVGCRDPFARVSGRGIQILQEAGVEVVEGVLEAECQALNAPFFTAQTLHRPYIVLKWARSADGFIDAWRESSEEAPPAALSSAVSLLRVHRLRAEAGAILVGHNTLTLDRPTLNVRYWGLPPSASQPLRIVLGRTAEGELPAGWEAYADVEEMLEDLCRRGVQTLLVEGGAHTLQTFIDEGLWDEAHEELCPAILGAGVPAPRMPFGTPMTLEGIDSRVVHVWKNE